MKHIELPGISTKILGKRCIYLEEVDSTNDFLKEHGREMEDGTVVIASEQIAGKGRLGRSWVSSRGEGLYLSVLLKNLAPNIRQLLPLICGLAVCKGLSRICQSECALKWSNDVLCGEKKICGILCESRITSESSLAIAGMGVNLKQTAQTLNGSGLLYATSLFADTGKIYDPISIASLIITELEEALDRSADQGWEELREEYKTRCLTIGRQIRVIQNNREIIAKSLDIAQDGSLICEGDGGEIFSVHSGETSVRGIYGYV